jgi:regulator of protease activity HflC (stomatin/prohibitin superfamily)
MRVCYSLLEPIAKPLRAVLAMQSPVLVPRASAHTEEPRVPVTLFVLGAIVVLGFVLVTSTVRIVQEYERGVIFRLGRLVGARGPGVFLLIPGVERMRKVDLRIVTLEVPAQEAITRDNVTVKVNAVVYFRVVDPEEAVVKVLDYVRATSLIGQTTLRSILGQSDLDHLLSERDKINAELQQVIDTQTSAWGVKVTSVEVRDLELPQTMQRAMARQAEAEREKRAKVIHAEGEFTASQQLANAAAVIGSQPATLQLRYLQTLTEIAAEKNSTIVFPLPLDLLQGFLRMPPPLPSDVNGSVPHTPTPS